MLHSCIGKKNAVLNQSLLIKTKEIKPTSELNRVYPQMSNEMHALPLTWKTFFLLDFSEVHSMRAPHKSTHSGLYPGFWEEPKKK